MFVVRTRSEAGAPWRVRRCLGRYEPVRPHQSQRLVSPAQDDSRVLGARRVVARRFGNSGEQRGFVDIIDGEGRELPAKIVFCRPGKSVLTVAHVDEARVSGENFFLRAALRPEPLPHLLFEPQREPHLLPLPSQHVDASCAHHRRQRPCHEPSGPKLVAVLLRRLAAEKAAAHELLSNRRPALREERSASYLVVRAAPSPAVPPACRPDLPDHARQAEVVDPVVGEEALVLGGQDRVTNDRWNVLVLVISGTLGPAR